MYWSRETSWPKAAASTPPPCSCRLASARSRSFSTVQPDLATPITGTERFPRWIIPWSAGKIFLKARSPVAPKNTRASEAAGSEPAPRALSEEAMSCVVCRASLRQGRASSSVRLFGHLRDVSGIGDGGRRGRPGVGDAGDSLVDPVARRRILCRSVRSGLGGRRSLPAARWAANDRYGAASLHGQVGIGLGAILLEVDLEGVHSAHARDLLDVFLPQAHQRPSVICVEQVRAALERRLLSGVPHSGWDEVDLVDRLAVDVLGPADHFLDPRLGQAHDRAVRPDLEDIGVPLILWRGQGKARPARVEIDLPDVQRLFGLHGHGLLQDRLLIGRLLGLDAEDRCQRDESEDSDSAHSHDSTPGAHITRLEGLRQ